MARRPGLKARRPRSPIRWLRSRVLPAIARVLTLGAALLVAVWIVGRVFTDLSLATQFLWWIPSLLVLALAWPMVFLAWALEKVATRLGGFQLRPLVTVVLTAITLFVCLGDWKLHRFFVPSTGGGLRLVYWNLAVDPGSEAPGETVLAHAPDLAVIANPRWDRTRQRLLESLGDLGRDDADPAAVHLVFRSEIIIATRARLARIGEVSFDMGTGDPEDRGVVVFAEIVGLAPEPVLVWVVDLPSRPTHHRPAVTARAREAIGAWRGPALVPDELGRWVPGPADGGFPAPHIIVGDFNTPRGSHSLEILTGGLIESHAAAGVGPSNTWPRGMPMLAIDLCYSAFPVRRHRVVDPGSGRHRMLVVELDTPTGR